MNKRSERSDAEVLICSVFPRSLDEAMAFGDERMMSSFLLKQIALAHGYSSKIFCPTIGRLSESYQRGDLALKPKDAIYCLQQGIALFGYNIEVEKPGIEIPFTSLVIPGRFEKVAYVNVNMPVWSVHIEKNKHYERLDSMCRDLSLYLDHPIAMDLCSNREIKE
ncbi:hypothetical protein HOA92_05595 [archaeon]|jgi:hypothetical protein|nr:hypothetical protein [archaeon]MBT6762487.1 hypothetical protein [archaeon]